MCFSCFSCFSTPRSSNLGSGPPVSCPKIARYPRKTLKSGSKIERFEFFSPKMVCFSRKTRKTHFSGFERKTQRTTLHAKQQHAKPAPSRLNRTIKLDSTRTAPRTAPRTEATRTALRTEAPRPAHGAKKNAPKFILFFETRWAQVWPK